ncbi:MAG: N-6 DNA methylase [Actinomycetales bacterium]|nr:N-6 DNA methylase [Candidatus Phosphoribacter baldrii]
MPPLDAAAKTALGDAKPAFDAAWDRWDRQRDAEGAVAAYRTARDEWIGVVLRDVLGLAPLWVPDDPVIHSAAVSSPDTRVQAVASGAIRHDERIGALVWVIDPVSSLHDQGTDGWAASPVDRMEAMLRAGHLPIGVVTDGRWWAIVSATPAGLAASGVFDAQTWIEEPATRNALVALLSVARLVGGREDERLPALFAESVLAAEEITEALGVQVRKAVELVVQAFADGSAEARDRGELDPLPDDGEVIYEAVVTVLMRVVFLLFAQERDLLPQGELFASGYGLVGQLDALDERLRHEDDTALDATHLTWHRLLATSQALYRGASFEDMRLPAYGGSLFDPDRFPFLQAVTERGTLGLAVSDLVMLKVLEAVQTARGKGQDARRISFRDIDVEQIGYIYEGLLGYSCQRAPVTTVGLIGGDGAEPEIPLDTLDELFESAGSDAAVAEAIIEWAKQDQPASKPPTKAALVKAMAAGDTMEDAERALLAVTRDRELRDRLRPWIGVIRRDLRGRPVVIHAGGLVVVETPSRKNAGAHYTPRDLAEEVVQHALDPLVYHPGPHQTDDRSAWRLRSSDELLDLKVADIACGSGAFLVAAARFLSARLVEAWRAEGSALGTPHDQEVRAIREVVAQCLYGADINAMAVEMCKLSLWLVSLDRDLPFSFVDDKLLHGNSLLGLTSLGQLEGLHITPSSQPSQGRFDFSGDALVERLDVGQHIQRAIRVRHRLASEIDETDPQRTAHAKRRQLAEVAELTGQLRRVADGVIAAGLPLGGRPGKALDGAYADLRVAVGSALPVDPDQADWTLLDSMTSSGLTPTVTTDYARWQPLHWPLEVPDVMERGGFDAIVGNPPFLGGKKVSGAVGSNLREWFVNVLANGAKGNADLVAYFFLRAAGLLKPSGTLGLIATNTVAQGDTREVGLDRLVAHGFTITRAIQSRSWPARSANLEYAAVWGTLAVVAHEVCKVSDEAMVRRISTLLEPEGRVPGNPSRLKENSGLAFIGCLVLGTGFIVESDEASDWIARSPESKRVLFPYLDGDALNSSPTTSASRWIIDFAEMSMAEANDFREPWLRVQKNVWPERSTKDPVKYPRMVKEWWKFWNSRPAMRKAISSLSHVIVIARVSRTVMPVTVPNQSVLHEKLVVFASDSPSMLAILTSSLHTLWAIQRGTTMRVDPTYTPERTFETFPRPSPSNDLDRVGRVLDGERREIMLRRELGLTKLYNLINDPDYASASDADVARMREIHVELDHVVRDAYGWSDLPLDHGFHTYRQMTRWTVSPAARVELLDRLLEENHRRAARQGSPPPDLDRDTDSDADEIGDVDLDGSDDLGGQSAEQGGHD